MIKRIYLFLFFCGAMLLVTFTSLAQLTPQQAIKMMVRGINMGNTLDPPDGEGTWGNPAVVATNFDDYKNAGFTCIRLPITWDKHVASTPPYTINAIWLNRIEQIVDWGLSRKLIIIINAHHDAWIKESFTVANAARFDSIWSQIAVRFKNKSDSLLFEIINEPYPMSLQNVNTLNARILNTIRKTNSTRIVLFSGHQWSNSAELLQAAVPVDNFLMGYYHSYDPWPYGLQGTGTYGSDADIATTGAKFQQVSNWATQKNIPVVLGEFGFIKSCEYNSRMCAYATDVEKALQYNVAFNVWDDGGNFKIYNRTERTWNEIKDILIHTYKESPNKLKINSYGSSSLKIEWNNRTTENDSIIVERKVNNGSFAFLAKVAPDVSSYIDLTTRGVNDYYYRLKANIKDSIEIQSYPIMKKVTSVVHVSDINYDIGGVSAFLEPGSDNVILKGLERPATISLYSLGGNQLITKQVNQMEYNFSVGELQNGLYLLKVTTNNKYIVKKILKQGNLN